MSVNLSKGVDYYGFVSNSSNETFILSFQKPTSLGSSTTTIPISVVNGIVSGNLQIAESDIGLTSHTGRFQWNLSGGNHLTGYSSIASAYAEIAPSTGSIGSSTLTNMLNTPSLINSQYAVSYGFYDSSIGVESITNQDQSYVYATPNQSNWMGSIASQVGSAPFASFVLPGAHDAGMFDTSCLLTLQDTDAFLNVLGTAAGIGAAIAQSLAPNVITRIVVNMAFTQKDTIPTMLNLGIRYFDFRPGYCMTDTQATGPLFHQHNFIPGYAFESFLTDILTWLYKNPTEIVVVALGHSGFNEGYMTASTDTLETYINNALAPFGNSILTGNKLDLTTSYNDLIAQKKRLIFLSQYGFESDPSQSPELSMIYDASKYDSYTDAYQTTDVNVILNALNGMNENGQSGYDYTVLQLQGTASGSSGGIFASAATMSDASSPLMSTKAEFDSKTYAWLQSNVATKFSNNQLLVCLNDFADNALAFYCSELTVLRNAEVSSTVAAKNI